MELALPELRVGGRPRGLSGLLELQALLAADHADSLAATFVEEDEPGRHYARPGEPVALLLDGRERFRGRVERATACLDPLNGPTAGIVARPEWAERAADLPPEEDYSEVTDAEVAARLADALGLEARIEATGPVHRRLTRRGDPLEFLRLRGRLAGRAAAIAGGRLIFAAAAPAGGPVREVDPRWGTLGLRASSRERGRSGALALWGSPEMFPLDRLRLRGFGPVYDGLHRIVRVRITIDPRGLWSEVFWVEEGSGLELDAADETTCARLPAREEARP